MTNKQVDKVINILQSQTGGEGDPNVCLLRCSMYTAVTNDCGATVVNIQRAVENVWVYKAINMKRPQNVCVKYMTNVQQTQVCMRRLTKSRHKRVHYVIDMQQIRECA